MNMNRDKEGVDGGREISRQLERQKRKRERQRERQRQRERDRELEIMNSGIAGWGCRYGLGLVLFVRQLECLNLQKLTMEFPLGMYYSITDTPFPPPNTWRSTSLRSAIYAAYFRLCFMLPGIVKLSRT